ncbi:shikimate dehydrogenase [Agromyces sp. MMS24-JH15]|uniref:shikimate dehydrogenase n=1 Tax=Agromyces sp. MMS24-JH15 TaxID=3243765 RepID=UPI003749D154
MTDPVRSDGARLAVLGAPIAHSRSPRLHGAAYRELGLDWEYGAVEVDAAGLRGFLDSRDETWRGLSLTFPLKHEVLGLVDRVDRVAGIAGAANTVRFAEGRRLGFNTDVGGIVRSLREEGVRGLERAAVVGGGATASSALIALAELGAGRIDVFVRNPAKADALVALGDRLGVSIRLRPVGDLATAQEDIGVVVATLPGGTDLGIGASESLRTRALLLDVVYGTWPTPLATDWAAVGGRAIDGLGMLLHQALLQVRIFVHGDPNAPVAHEDRVLAAMRASIA